MKLAHAFLELEDAPLDLRVVSLRVGFKDTKRAQKTRDFDLPRQLVKAALEQAIASALFEAQTLAS